MSVLDFTSNTILIEFSHLDPSLSFFSFFPCFSTCCVKPCGDVVDVVVVVGCTCCRRRR